MRGDGVGELGVVLDLLDHADDFRRHLLVELHIVLELVDDRARQRLGLDLLAADRRPARRRRPRNIRRGRCSARPWRAAAPSTSTFTVPSGSLSSCSTLASVPISKIALGRRIVVGGVLLRREQDERVGAHHLFERLDRLLAADEERHDHVREDDDVAQRQHRIGPGFAGDQRRTSALARGHGPKSLLLCPSAAARGCGSHDRVPRWAGKGARRPRRHRAPEGGYETLPGEFRRDPSYAFSFAQ